MVGFWTTVHIKQRVCLGTNKWGYKPTIMRVLSMIYNRQVDVAMGQERGYQVLTHKASLAFATKTTRVWRFINVRESQTSQKNIISAAPTRLSKTSLDPIEIPGFLQTSPRSQRPVTAARCIRCSLGCPMPDSAMQSGTLEVIRMEVAKL